MDDAAEAIHAIVPMMTVAIIAMDAIAVVKKSPIVAIDVTDATDATTATINQMSDAAQAAEAVDLAVEAKSDARVQRKGLASNAPLNAAMEKAAPIPIATEWGRFPMMCISSTGAIRR